MRLIRSFLNKVYTVSVYSLLYTDWSKCTVNEDVTVPEGLNNEVKLKYKL